MFALLFDSVSFSEWLVLFVVFMIVVGPRKIPETARTIGNYYSKFRRAAESFKRQILEMETEFNKAAQEAEKEVEDAFKSDGDESEATPPDDVYYSSPDSPYPGQEMYDGYDGSEYYNQVNESDETQSASDSESSEDTAVEQPSRSSDKVESQN